MLCVARRCTRRRRGRSKRAEPPKGAQRVVPVEKTVGITEQQSDNDDEPVKKADGSIDHVATAEKQMRKIYKR